MCIGCFTIIGIRRLKKKEITATFHVFHVTKKEFSATILQTKNREINNTSRKVEIRRDDVIKNRGATFIALYEFYMASRQNR